MRTILKFKFIATFGLSFALLSNEGCNKADDSLGITSNSTENISPCDQNFNSQYHIENSQSWLGEIALTGSPFNLGFGNATEELEVSARDIWKVQYGNNNPKYIVVYSLPYDLAANYVNPMEYGNYSDDPVYIEIRNCDGSYLGIHTSPKYVQDFCRDAEEAYRKTPYITDRLEETAIAHWNIF